MDKINGMTRDEKVREEFQKYYEDTGWPECENNSDEMYSMTVEHFKYEVVNPAFIAGWDANITGLQQFIEWLETQPDYKNLYQEWKFQKDNV